MPNFYVMPVDPECPEVANYRAAVDEDPMSAACGCMDEILELFEKRHVAKCARCREYGVANIEVGDA